MEEPPQGPEQYEEAAPASAVEPPHPQPRRRGIVFLEPPRLRALDVLILIAIMLLIGGVHLARLANPDRALPATDDQCKKYPRLSSVCHEMIPLDEYHYLPDARDAVRYGTESDQRIEARDNARGYTDGAYVVHPPVGKWFIAAGIKLFGDSGVGWRFFGAILGVLGSLVMWLIARRLWGSPWLAHAAAFLLGIEGLWLVMSRIAMLDIYTGFFVLLGVWLLLEDRARADLESRGLRWWRIASGVSWGLALGSKWGALPFLAVAAGGAIFWAVSDEIYVRRPRPFARIAGAIAALVVLPGLVYAATYTSWFTDPHRYNPPKCRAMDAGWLSDKGIVKTVTGWIAHTGRYGQWICYQKEVASFHANLRTFNVESKLTTITPRGGRPTSTFTQTEKLGHPYFGSAWAWPWIGRPVAHYYVTFGEGADQRIKHIAGIPNPVIWWSAFFIGLPLMVLWSVRSRDGTAGMILAFALAGWLPYLYGDATGKGVFFFYATPMVPFLVLAVVHVMARAHAWSDAAAVWSVAFIVLATLVFVYLYPVLTAYPLRTTGFWSWRNHMWLYGPKWRFFGRFIIRGDCTAAGNVVKHFCWV